MSYYSFSLCGQGNILFILKLWDEIWDETFFALLEHNIYNEDIPYSTLLKILTLASFRRRC